MINQIKTRQLTCFQDYSIVVPFEKTNALKPQTVRTSICSMTIEVEF